MSDLPPGVDEEDFELYGDAEPQDPVDDYGDDHGIPESHQNGHAPVKVEPNDDPMEDEAENGDDPMEDEAQNGDDDAADAPDAKEDGERDDDEEDEEEEDSSDDEFVVNVGEIKRPEPKVQGVQGKVDLDSTPLINGQPIYDLDLATMEDRPWRKPGADINDYFNYGFNEESWNMYCERQKKLRHEFSNNQAAVNKSLFNSINILNPILTTTSTGRQLVNICGAENPHNNHKVVVDLTKPPPAQLSMNIKQENIIRTDLTNIIPKSSASTDAKPIAVLDFSKPPPMMQNLVVSQPTQDGPPGMEDSAAPGTEPTTPSVGHQGSAIPTMDMSMPPPGFNPNMPPPQMRGPPPTHMLPPGFGGMTANHAMAGFANPPPRFSRPPPLRDFHPPGYGQPPGMDGFDQPRDYIERSFSGESDDEEHRRSRKHRRRSHSRSPSSKRRREDKDRDRERERDRDYGRERNEERDRERERGERERGDRDRDRERTERRRRHEEHERESSRSSRSRRDRGERDDREKEREKRHRDSDSESGRKERRRREVSGEKESRRERGKD